MAMQGIFAGSFASATATGGKTVQTTGNAVTLGSDIQSCQHIFISYDDTYVNAAAQTVVMVFGGGSPPCRFIQAWQHSADSFTTELWEFNGADAAGTVGDPPYVGDIQVTLLINVNHLVLQTAGVSMVSYNYYGPLIDSVERDEHSGGETNTTAKATLTSVYNIGLQNSQTTVADNAVYVAALFTSTTTGVTVTLTGGTEIIAPFTVGSSPTLFAAALAYIRCTGGADTISWSLSAGRDWIVVMIAPAPVWFDPVRAWPNQTTTFLR